MAVKQTGQPSFIEAWLPKGAGANAALDRLSSLVKWYRFEKLMAHLRDEGSPGRPGYPVLVLFRALLLQSLYGLSERELEEALGDRLSFKRFVGLSLEDATPDHTVLNRFRNQLVEQGLLDKLFGELDRQLENAGVILKRGTMLDATLIQAVSAPPTQEQPSKDPDARFAKRQGKSGSTFGYKAHMGVDEGSGLIRSVLTTPANINDTTPADDLIRGDEAVVWADAAYDTHARRARLKAEGKKPRIARRPNRHHPELPPRLKRYNLLIARRRATVETTFATLKRRMRLTCIRYVGLAKASGQVLLASIAFNMRKWAAITA
ncbi:MULTISPECIES: IS5 family transposase [unclassified Bradyrhizobium]|uniref:IS5 family transposase n=1 Tax=unclassified Bradyrhizobium TaxID=2631580 RepID=UPI002478465C|nr:MULTISPECIES: IS5 family transposase [unclassified Bradyrhizobium]WGR68972.1 IS5 family transposase [Bradyrhizobium sp. ISRA426]WGR69250.1 IS5 family transposase [Bradyrhizobium sp. ISRA426]WGR70786.1 IS5 family transposase [Bradyrhizobium sp. ISRA426]WGR70941.1 IS5 family transposase [Bradyrhizobium sp. ISRA426]WGR71017.1 IS5 family transposase [Bradyrhizobium sp. ISRA426]